MSVSAQLCYMLGSYRRRIEKHNFSSFQDQKPWLIALPRNIIVDNTFVDPAHVVDALTNGKVSIVQFNLM